MLHCYSSVNAQRVGQLENRREGRGARKSALLAVGELADQRVVPGKYPLVPGVSGRHAVPVRAPLTPPTPR